MNQLISLGKAKYYRLVSFVHKLRSDWKSYDWPIKICIIWISSIIILTGMLGYYISPNIPMGIIFTIAGCIIGFVVGFLSAFVITVAIYIVILVVYILSLIPVFFFGKDSTYYVKVTSLWDKFTKKV